MLTLSTLLGASWTVTSRMSGRAVDFLLLLLLARMLTPGDFGMTALAMSFVAILDTVLEVPLIQALTRLNTIEQSHLDTAFTLGLLRGLALFTLMAIAAYPISVIYDDPHLSAIIIVLAIGPIARGLVSPRMVGFVKALHFRQVFIIELVGKGGAAALALAVLYLGGGYWAIVANSVAASSLTAIASYVIAPYRPGITLKQWPEFRDMMGWFSFSQLVAALNWQIDRIILGNFIPRHTLGQYTMAGDIAVLPTQTLIGPAMQPLMAAFSHIQDDPQRLRSAYLRASRFVMMLAVPACVGMSLTAPLLVSVLLGPNWVEAATYLQFISLTIVLAAYFQPLYSLSIMMNRTRTIFQINLIDFLIRILIVPVSIYFFSIMGLIAARGVLSLMIFFCCMLYARWLVHAGIRLQLGNLWKIAAACLLMALAVVALGRYLAQFDLPPFVELVTLAGSGAFVYLLVLYGLGVRLRGPDVRFSR